MVGRAGAVTGTAQISALEQVGSGVSLTGNARYEPGIGRVDFVLIDLGNEQPPNVVDREDIDYTASFPEEANERWASTAPLVSGATYRALFHVYDRGGTNLVAYDRRDFTCTHGGHGEPGVER